MLRCESYEGENLIIIKGGKFKKKMHLNGERHFQSYGR